jgi:ribosomal protein L16 Arg81 hydroxylase
MNFHDASLAAFVQAVQKETCLSGDIDMNCYVTPPHSGSPEHFDSQNVIFCQVSGTKHWRYSLQPATENPPLNLVFDHPAYPPTVAAMRQVGMTVRAPAECEFAQVTLQPGDALYLPPGVWHVPCTSESASLHYTLTFRPFGFLNVLFPVMRMLMLRNGEWRRELRFLDEPGREERLVNFLQQRLGEVTEAMRALDGPALLAELREARRIAPAGYMRMLFHIQ